MEPRLRLPSILYGLCMGCADIVPGISGGTIAFIMGFYQPLIEMIRGIDSRFLSLLIRFRFKELGEAWPWRFALGLLSGFVLAFALFSNLFNFLLNDPVYRVYLYSAFLGLISASIFFCAKQIKGWEYKHIISFFVGVIAAWIFSGNLSTPSGEEKLYDVPLTIEYRGEHALVNYKAGQFLGVPESALAAMIAKGVIHADTLVYSLSNGEIATAKEFVGHLTLPYFDLWIIFCGALAVCAMLLPGISGSYMLTILGVYPLIIAAIADFFVGIGSLHIEWDALLFMLNMQIGIVIGAAGFSRVIAWLFKWYHDATIVLLTGFMVGALRSVWPFWSVEFFLSPLRPDRGPRLELIEPFLPDLSNPMLWIATIFALFGFLLVTTITKVANNKI